MSLTAFPFRVLDNSGALVAGATIKIGTTTLTSNLAPVSGSPTATSVPANAGEYLLATGAAPAGALSITLIDYQTGDYAFVYDPVIGGEMYFPLTASKGGSTITGQNALIALICTVPGAPASGSLAPLWTGNIATPSSIQASLTLISGPSDPTAVDRFVGAPIRVSMNYPPDAIRVIHGYNPATGVLALDRPISFSPAELTAIGSGHPAVSISGAPSPTISSTGRVTANYQ